MEESWQLKSEHWKKRLCLMRTLTQMQASGNIHLKVEEILRSSQDKEQVAERITQVLNQNEDEAKILKALEAIKEKRRGMVGNKILEVCFGDSECGLIKYALRKASNEVLNLSGLLDIGRIDAFHFWEARKEWIDIFFEGCSESERKKILQEEKDKVTFILNQAKQGGSLRVWISDAAFSQCGLYWLVHLLQGIECEIFISALESSEDGESAWGLQSPEKVISVSLSARKMRHNERETIVAKWQKLCSDSVELRIVENGELKSVSVDYFDEAILSLAPDGVFSKTKLLGTMIGTCKRYVHDAFVAERIVALINQGKLQIVHHSNEKSDEILLKVSEKN